MASRWMQQMKARERAFRRREAKISLTERERKFYQRQRGESIEHHLWRMLLEAEKERNQPTEWWRALARVLQVIQGPFDAVERELVAKGIRLGRTIAETEQAILRYRRLTGRDVETVRKLDRDEEYARLALGMM